jgi:YfiH family protein
VPSALTSRAGGVSTGAYDGLNLGDHVGDDPGAVTENRRRLRQVLARPVQYMRQVHGRDVAVVHDGAGWPAEGAPEADAMVTTAPDRVLAVLVADCVPVVLAGPGIVAVAHAGRAGLAAGVIPATVSTMIGLGADAAALTAAVGPSVCGLCYEVPAGMRADVAGRVPAAWASSRAGTPALDLRAGVAAQLSDLGVGSIAVSRRCTREDPRLYSHRRDGMTGRFAALAWLGESVAYGEPVAA